MARVQLQPFTGKLWVSTDRVLTPQGALRRAKGLSPIRSGSLRSTRGSTQQLAFAPELSVAHSLFHFGGSIYSGIDSALYKDAAPLTLPALNGNRLVFVKAPITVGSEDILYITGGGQLIKTDGGGLLDTWGVAPPTDGFLAIKTPNFTQAFTVPRPITALQISAPTTVAVGQSVTYPVDALAPATPTEIELGEAAGSIDLTVWSGPPAMPSFTGDYIALYIMCDAPANLQSVSIRIKTFIDGSPQIIGWFIRTLNIATNPTTAALPSAPVTPSQIQAAGGVAITPTPTSTEEIQRFLTSGFTPGTLTNQASRVRTQVGVDNAGKPIYAYSELSKQIVGGTSTIQLDANVWQLLLIPKNTFIPDDAFYSSFIGGASPNSPEWSGVVGIGASATAIATVQTGGGHPICTVYLGPTPGWPVNAPYQMIGGSPIYGTVQYRITYVDTVTGAESNPNPAYLQVILGQTTPTISIQSLLSAVLQATDSSLTVMDATSFPAAGGKIQIDSEILLYTGKSGNTLTGLTRSVDISTATEHTAGTAVTFFTEVTAVDVNRHPVTLQGLPTPPTGQFIRLYRTLGNNAVFFKAVDLIAGTTPMYNAGAGTFTDTYADYASTDSDPLILSATELLFDNVAPSALYQDAVYWQGRMWWLRDGTQRLYYSPPGRYEAVSNFIEITSSEDTLQKAVEWQGALYVFSERRIIAVSGDEPFSFQTVAGAPGTTDPFTVVPTTAGIFYRAKDGVRVFNGLQSTPVSFDALGPLFRGQPAEDLQPFHPIIMASSRDEIWTSDGTQTLVYSIGSDAWRTVGRSLNALYYDQALDLLFAATVVNDGVNPAYPVIWSLEDFTAANDAGFPIQVDWQTASLSPAVDAFLLVQRLYVSGNFNGQTIQPFIEIDENEYQLPMLRGLGFQTYEISLNKSGRVIGVRFTGSVLQPIEISRVELDIEDGGQ